MATAILRKVVFNGTRKPMKVVTVYFDRAMRGKL